MTEIKATIQNEAGIHCRPTAEIVKAAAEYDGIVTMTSEKGSCKLGSALELLMLGLERNTEIILRVEGPHEETVAEQFKTLFETQFDFPPVGT